MKIKNGNTSGCSMENNIDNMSTLTCFSYMNNQCWIVFVLAVQRHQSDDLIFHKLLEYVSPVVWNVSWCFRIFDKSTPTRHKMYPVGSMYNTILNNACSYIYMPAMCMARHSANLVHDFPFVLVLGRCYLVVQFHPYLR